MLPKHPIFSLSCLTIALTFSLAACAPHPSTDRSPQEQRLLDLERRVERLKARPEAEPPFRSKAEIQAHIRGLEAERGKLLISYTAQHPAIKDIDRKLEILNNQLKMLE